MLLNFRSFLNKRRRWEQALDWLDAFNTEDQSCLYVINQRKAAVAALHYDITLPGFSRNVVLTTENLGIFLSDEWTKDEMINAGAEYILHQLDPPS
jgi:precorrin-4 methylase